MNPSYIIDAARTPRGRGKAGKGSLSDVHPQELLATVLRALEQRVPSMRAADVDDVIVGAVSQIGEQGANIARNAVLAAGWPYEVPAVSLNRFCSSGQQAVHFAAMAVGSGAMDLVVAAGVESMSRYPLGADGGGQDGANLNLRKRVFQVPQGISADLIATREGLSRHDIDTFALRSQQLAARAMAEGRFARSLVPVHSETGALLLGHDESVRADTSAEGLAKLSPAFVTMGNTVVGAHGETLDAIALRAHPIAGGIEHVHTAGNSSGLSDGAAAVVVASEAYVRKHRIRPRARIRAVATLGSDPVLMLTAPAPVSEKALHQAGMRASDIDLWEINEAFAAVVLQTQRALNVDIDRINVNGGAIALGHPLGATGAMLIGTALDELERTNKTTALITMCIGGGQGLATIIERV